MTVRLSPRKLKILLRQPTLEVAQSLLGFHLYSGSGTRVCGGEIVEVEAYRGDVDPASHCYHRRTPRNEIMFQEPGHIYVYMIYGLHYCVNIVTELPDFGAAVLIRAIRPTLGINLMARRRKTKNLKLLCNGPARLCQAMGIDQRLNGTYLHNSDKIWLSPGKLYKPADIATGARIGISKGLDLPWRFYLKDNPWVSRR